MNIWFLTTLFLSSLFSNVAATHPLENISPDVQKQIISLIVSVNEKESDEAFSKRIKEEKQQQIGLSTPLGSATLINEDNKYSYYSYAVSNLVSKASKKTSNVAIIYDGSSQEQCIANMHPVLTRRFALQEDLAENIKLGAFSQNRLYLLLVSYISDQSHREFISGPAIFRVYNRKEKKVVWQKMMGSLDINSIKKALVTNDGLHITIAIAHLGGHKFSLLFFNTLTERFDTAASYYGQFYNLKFNHQETKVGCHWYNKDHYSTNMIALPSKDLLNESHFIFDELCNRPIAITSLKELLQSKQVFKKTLQTKPNYPHYNTFIIEGKKGSTFAKLIQSKKGFGLFN